MKSNRSQKMQELKIKEEFKDQLPPLKVDEYIKLEKSICELGCQYPIRTWNGYIIDGHHRHKICQQHGVEFKTLSMDEVFKNETDARIWIIDHQEGSRNLSDFERIELAMAREHLEERRRGQRNDLTSVRQRTEVKSLVEKDKQKPTRKSAALAGLGKTKYFQGKYIAEHGSEQQKEDLRKNKTTVKEVYKDLKRNAAKEQAIRNLESIGAQKAKTLSGVYDVIVLDPPWDIKKVDLDVRPNQSKYLDYPTMSIDEIKAMDVPCADDCHVFLWTTQKYLFDAKDIINSWGLKYIWMFVWHKDNGFKPFGLPKSNCEFILYARKGNPKFVDERGFFSCFNGKSGRHSEKPEEFYDMLRRVTAGRRLDMFNRREIEGFEGWGNESVV